MLGIPAPGDLPALNENRLPPGDGEGSWALIFTIYDYVLPQLAYINGNVILESGYLENWSLDQAIYLMNST